MVRFVTSTDSAGCSVADISEDLREQAGRRPAGRLSPLSRREANTLRCVRTGLGVRQGGHRCKQGCLMTSVDPRPFCLCGLLPQ